MELLKFIIPLSFLLVFETGSLSQNSQQNETIIEGSFQIVKAGNTKTKKIEILSKEDLEKWKKKSSTKRLIDNSKYSNNRLEVTSDELPNLFLCFNNVSIVDSTSKDDKNNYNLDNLKVNNLFSIQSTKFEKSKLLSEIFDGESVSTKGSNNSVKINLDWLLKKSLNVESELDTKRRYEPEPDFTKNYNKQLLDLIASTEGIELRILNKDIRLKIKNSKSEYEPDSITIDPRLYVTIYEKKSKDDDLNPIWHMLPTGSIPEFSPKQYYTVIGDNSLLEIHFDNKGLAKNIDFRGSIGLKATYGDQDIPVYPYFVPGKEKKSHGVNSLPIKELADNYLRLMIEASKVANIYQGPIEKQLMFLSNATENNVKSDEDLKKDLLTYLEEARLNLMLFFREQKRNQKLSYNKVDSVSLKQYENEFDFLLTYISSPLLYQTKNHNFSTSIDSIIKELNELDVDDGNKLRPNSISNYKLTLTKLDINDLSEGKETPNIEKDYLELLKSMDRFSRYMSYLFETDASTQEAFFSISNITKIDFKVIHNQVIALMKTIQTDFNDWNKITDAYNTKSAQLYSFINNLHKAYLYINEFNNQSPQFSGLLDKYGYTTTFLNKHKLDELIKIDENNLPSTFKDYDFEGFIRFIERTITMQDKQHELKKIVQERQWHYLDNPDMSLLFDTRSYYAIRKKLAEWAGDRIFEDLVYATIDLRDVKTNDKDELKVSLVWDLGNVKSVETASQKSLELATAQFVVKKVGWHMEATESILLINRLKQNQLSPEYPLSPSNFKPTAGGSLMWTYHNDYRGNSWGGRTLRWLELSAGVNVSFLDFNTKKDFEVGAGLIAGFFKNQLFITGGYNLSVEGLSPWYWGLGFSFTNAIEKITSKAKENEAK